MKIRITNMRTLMKWSVWILVLPLLFLIGLLVVKTYTPEWNINILFLISGILMYLSVFEEFFKKLFNKLEKYKQISYIRDVLFLELAFVVLGFLIYLMFTEETIGDFSNMYYSVASVFTIVVTWGFFILLLGVLFGKVRVDGFPKIVSRYLYVNTIFLIFYFIFINDLKSLDIINYTFIHLIMSFNVIGYIYLILRNLKEFFVDEKNHVEFILMVVGTFFANIIALNLLSFWHNPASFRYGVGILQNEFSIIYYSVTNITSVGFGDITPIVQETQMISIISSILGYFLLFMIVAYIINKIGSNNSKSEEKN